MKIYNQLAVYALMSAFFISSCTNQSNSNKEDNDQDTIVIRNIDTTYKKSINVSQISIDTNLLKAQIAVTNKQINSLNNIKNAEFKASALENLSAQIFSIDAIVDTSKASMPQSAACVYPSSIRDLKDGILLQGYDFKKGDEYKLGLMGFFNVDIQNESKVTVVEFSQSGSTQCEGKTLPYGIGARLMLQVIKKKRNAKLETPQQITASVIFDRAEVKYNVKTFGITGPKTASLIRSGILSENTYNDFINAIADMVIDAYKANSEYIINPQYMPLKQ